MPGRGGYGASQVGVPTDATGPGTSGLNPTVGGNDSSGIGLNISTSADDLAKDQATRIGSKLADDFYGNNPLFQMFPGLKNMLPSEVIDYMNYHNTTPTQISDEQRNGNNRDNIIRVLSDRANNGDNAALELLFNYYATRSNELEARKYNELREDTAYQRLMDDFKKAGISPYILSGANPVGFNTTSHAYTGSQLVSQQSNKNTVESNDRKAAFESILKLMGVVIGAMIMAA